MASPDSVADQERRDSVAGACTSIIAELGVRVSSFGERKPFLDALEEVEAEISTGQLWFQFAEGGVETCWIGDPPGKSLDFLQASQADGFINALALALQRFTRPNGDWSSTIIGIATPDIAIHLAKQGIERN